ncbi:MAG: hypothetical protein HKN73_07440, partial [Gemmatimonadetes bacterium]|nr:hypothetical protein [Gemmatimonadota bacterium]
EYRRAVEKLFARGLADRLPGFEPVRVSSPLLFGGEKAYRWRATQSFDAHVLLVPSPQGHQSFTVEIAWSDRGRFPEGGMRPSVMLAPGDPWPTDVNEGIVRLGGLAGTSDAWWHLPDPAVENPGDLDALVESTKLISPTVAEAYAEEPVSQALASLERHGVPFVEAVVMAHGGVESSPRHRGEEVP